MEKKRVVLAKVAVADLGNVVRQLGSHSSIKRSGTFLRARTELLEQSCRYAFFHVQRDVVEMALAKQGHRCSRIIRPCYIDLAH